MFAILKTAALATLLGVAALSVSPNPAQAGGGGLYLGFGSGHQGPGFSFRFDDRGHYDRRDGRRDEWRGHRRGDKMRGPACSPRAAIHRASQMGLRRGQIVHAGPRTITVQGRVRGHGFAVMTFSRAPHCPRIR